MFDDSHESVPEVRVWHHDPQILERFELTDQLRIVVPVGMAGYFE